MARRFGPPHKGETPRPTSPARLPADLAEMLGWVARVENMRASAILNKIVRPALTQQFSRYADIIARLKALDAEEDALRASAEQSVSETGK